MQARRDDSKKKSIRFGDLLDDINKARGEKALGAWVKDACQAKLDAEKSEKVLGQRGSVVIDQAAMETLRELAKQIDSINVHTV